MIYYRVRKECDQKRISKGKGKFLVAKELYTKGERNKMSKVSDEAFEQVHISKNKTFWFFGARFEKCESEWRK